MIRLWVDATDVVRRIYNATIVIPVRAAGPLTLLYPKWLPGFHSPQAPIELLAGLKVRAGGKDLRWIRHPVTVNAFHIEVPDGATEVEARIQFLSPTEPKHGRVLVSEDLLMLPWNTVILYPAGHFARQILVRPSLRLPDGWACASALEQEGNDGAIIHFKPVSLDMLVDSPVMAGQHFRTFKLDATGEVKLHVAADRPALLECSDEQVERHRAIVAQCDKLFRQRHFKHFDILLALSDELTAEGIEHHQSCEAVCSPDYFKVWNSSFPERSTAAHEYVHSWNGKHRRGADSWSPCFERPIRNSLMWVYEGLTQYWTHVIAARSGLWSLEQTLGALAQTAAMLEQRPGSQWRPLIDTTRDPIIAARNPLPWTSWQRSEDYYSEGVLIWLDIDTRLRELTNDAQSLDDFAASFFGSTNERLVTQTYQFDDVVDALNVIAPFDWQGLLKRMLSETRSSAPLYGLERSGYNLVFRDQPNIYTAALQDRSGISDHSFSIGLKADSTGKVSEVLWDSPAFDQGITSGATLVAVYGRPFSPSILSEAVKHCRSAGQMQITIQSSQRVRTCTLRYEGGLRYPHLEQTNDQSRLDRILSPL
jgi:predicted metalloprotease with PDZ domain